MTTWPISLNYSGNKLKEDFEGSIFVFGTQGNRLLVQYMSIEYNNTLRVEFTH